MDKKILRTSLIAWCLYNAQILAGDGCMGAPPPGCCLEYPLAHSSAIAVRWHDHPPSHIVNADPTLRGVSLWVVSMRSIDSQQWWRDIAYAQESFREVYNLLKTTVHHDLSLQNHTRRIALIVDKSTQDASNTTAERPYVLSGWGFK